MTIEQVVEILKGEQQHQVPARFPCRAIMVRNISQYNELLSRLREIIGAELVSSEELFSSADLMPQYENLTDSKYWNRWVILTGVSEYLRLFSKSEAEVPNFTNLWNYRAPSDSLGRILIPLWGCAAQWHDRTLHLSESPRRADDYYDCSEESDEDQKLEIVVLSGAFEQHTSGLSKQTGRMSIGLRDWYDYWRHPDPEISSLILLTRRHFGIQPVEGNISVRVIRDMLSFVRESLADGQALTGENCSEEALALLFSCAQSGASTDAAILSALNAQAFSGADMMGRWKTLTIGQQQLVLLWLRLHPDESYLSHCAQKADTYTALPQHIQHDIFDLRGSHSNWESESQALMEALDIPKDSAFFEGLNCIPVYEERLPYLSDKTKEERIYLLRLIGRWMREEPGQIPCCTMLETVYPALSAYLNGTLYDEDLRGYFASYKTHKLENSLPPDEELFFGGIQADSYDHRYSVLSGVLTESCIVLWIDALGAEWLPLLHWALCQSTEGVVRSAAAAQASLPSKTGFNKHWEDMDVPHKKIDRLDKLAHQGVIDEPDYYACVEEQIAFVTGIRETAEELLKTYHRVVITGDHGTSRLAARFFHERDGLPVPRGAEIGSHGRYCILPDGDYKAQPGQIMVKDVEGKQYAVFTSYDHFSQRGFAAGTDEENPTYGEIHGGAAPEEVLVPVVVFEGKKELPLTAKWQKNPIKIMAKRAKAVLDFSRAVEELQAKIGPVDGVCTPEDNKKRWTIVFRDIAPKIHPVTIAADGKLVHMEPLEIQPALGGGEGDLP